jgi:flagellar biosynthesis anti-sigma factor FlgM
MKIDHSHIQPTLARIAPERSADARSGASRPAESASEAIRLSDTGRKLASLRGPEVPDEARIERLRELVTAGKLPVDPNAIADAILREDR